MTKFKVGDRVAVYNNGRKLIGTIKEIDKASYPEEDIFVDWDFLQPEAWFSSKQCRKLVKKERRRVWISKDWLIESEKTNGQAGFPANTQWNLPPLCNPSPFIEFIEVRREVQK